jgi:hypothetical protein
MKNFRGCVHAWSESVVSYFREGFWVQYVFYYRIFVRVFGYDMFSIIVFS